MKGRGLSQILEHVDHFQHRVIQDAIAEATAAYWTRRARDFARVGTPECDEIAQACRSKAVMVREFGIDQDESALIAREMGAA